MKRLLALVLFISILIPSIALAAKYEIDKAHSLANFAVKHMMVTNVRGSFSDMSGTIAFDPQALDKSSFEATLAATSIDTGVAKRDDHLRSADFFDVANHPTIQFKSTGIKRLGPENYEIAGNLTIHGVTKPVTLKAEGLDTEMKDPMGNFKRGAHLTSTIDRRDFGLTWNKTLETGGVVVGNEVRLDIDLELAKAK